MPLKSYYDSLPKSDIKVMTEMQKTVCIQFNRVTISGEVMYKSKKGGKDQETIQSSTTPDQGYHMGK